MEVKHTHPQYHTEAQRLSKLKDAHNASLAAISRIRIRERGANVPRSA